MDNGTKIPKEGTQARKLLDVLLGAKGGENDGWINGQYFCRTFWLTQFHAVIFRLENEYGWAYDQTRPEKEWIEHSEFTDEFGFRSYRIHEGAPVAAALV